MHSTEQGWPSGRARDGGVDRVPVDADGEAGVWLCGKHAIGPGAEALLARIGATTVVCLVEDHEIADRYPEYREWLRANAPARAIHFPIPDLGVPSVDRFLVLLEELSGRIDRDECLLVHCAAGFGRTGTLVACLLVMRGMSADEALRLVAHHRPMAGPEVGAQRALVDAVAELAARRCQ